MLLIIFLCRITESKNPNFPVGKFVAGSFGWRTHSISNGEAQLVGVTGKPYVLPDFGTLSPSLGLGILGMTGYVTTVTVYMIFNTIILESHHMITRLE